MACRSQERTPTIASGRSGGGSSMTVTAPSSSRRACQTRILDGSRKLFQEWGPTG